jgi:thioredoxin-related protein
MKTIFQFILNKIFLCSLIILSLNLSSAFGQEKKSQVYNPRVDAEKELKEAISKAGIDKKHVLISVGGNWCQWCIKFYNYCKADKELDSLIQANYVEIKVNYSDENKNASVLKKLDNPDKLGFPIFVILDENGKRLYTQESGSLFADNNWDRNKIITFLNKWAKQ